MTKLMVLLAAAALALGAVACKKETKKVEAMSEPPANTGQPTPPAAEPTPAPEPARPPTAEEKVQAYKDCVASISAKDWARFAACYTEDAEATFANSGMETVTGGAEIAAKGPQQFAEAFPDLTVEPQLILQNGDKIAAILFIKGTHTQPLKGPSGDIPATNKKVGLYLFHTGQFAPDKPLMAKDWHFMDSGTLFGQLGLSKAPHRPAADHGMNPEPIVVIAKDDETEKNNLAAAQKCQEAFEKRDYKTSAAFWAPDGKMMDMSSPLDANVKQAQAFMKQLIMGFPDAKSEIVDQWAAGDYVVTVSHNSGTNSGPMAMMGIKKPTGKKVDFLEAGVMKLEGGKLKQGWSFLDGMFIGMQLGLIVPPAPASASAAVGGEKAETADPAKDPEAK